MVCSATKKSRGVSQSTSNSGRSRMIPYVIVSIIFAIFVFFINIYCVVIIVRSRKLHNPPQMCIFSLLLGHALQGLITIPCYAAKRQGIYKNTAVCDIFRFSYLLTNYWCCLSVLVISIDRFIGVSFPLHYKCWVTSARMRITFICVWLYIFILCLIPFAPSTKQGCKYNPQREWVITMLLVNTLLPFVIIVALYALILRRIRSATSELRKQLTMDKQISGAQQDARKARSSASEFKRTKMTFFIVGTYVLCWGPSLFYYLLLSFCPDTCFSKNYKDSTTEEIVGFLIKFLTFVDGVVAPLVYCWASRYFQKLRGRAFKSIRNMFFKDSASHVTNCRRSAAVVNRKDKISVSQTNIPKTSLGEDVLNNVRTISCATLFEHLDGERSPDGKEDGSTNSKLPVVAVEYSAASITDTSAYRRKSVPLYITAV